MKWSAQFLDLLTEPMTGIVAPTAYDTAWVARVPDRNAANFPAFPTALDWVLQHQHNDGSWGAQTVYHHDRLLSTLRAALTLAFWQDRQGHTKWAERINGAIRAIWRHASWLDRDPYELVGFELIFPTLVEEACARGFTLPLRAFEQVMKIRDDKIKRAPLELVYSLRTPLLFSAEFLGATVDIKRLSTLLDDEGSLGASPSASAYYLIHNPEGDATRGYLRRVVEHGEGGAAAVDPIDVFEPAWALYNAMLVWPNADEIAPIVAPIVHTLQVEIANKRGATFALQFPVTDLDDTAMVLAVLQWAGVPVALELLHQFEGDDVFRCYANERNPSISAHIHLLEAMRAAPPSPERVRVTKKVMAYLEGARTAHTYWFDKWHASPYYATAHAVIAMPRDSACAQTAVDWLVNTQRPDGSWGYYDAGTPEETAYALQALISHFRGGGKVGRAILDSAARFLEDSMTPQIPSPTPLWLTKCVYTPVRVVRSSLLSALAMMERL
jgi:halimadienyl-diphosphate synthase